MNINVTILGQAISFFIFVLFCMKYVWMPMISIIEKRQKEISDTFSSIDKSKKILEINQIKASSCLKDAKVKADLIIEQANQYRIQLINEAKSEAKFEQKKILSKAYDAIRIEKKCVSETLQKEISKIIILGIEKIIECSVNKDCIDNAIINKFLDELQTCKINTKYGSF